MMSSNTAKDFSVPKHSLYSGSKGAIDSFVRVFSKDCGDKKITVNAVAPGGTVTDMFHAVSAHYIPNGDSYSAEEREKVSLVIFEVVTSMILTLVDGCSCLAPDSQWLPY